MRLYIIIWAPIARLVLLLFAINFFIKFDHAVLPVQAIYTMTPAST